MADEFVVRLKRELEEIRRSGYGHDWPLSQAIAVIETQQAEIERLRTAGDALAATWPEEERCGCNNPDCRAVVAAYDAWREARRG